MAYHKRVKVTIDKVPAIMAGISVLAGTRIMAGVPAAKAERDDDEPINNAQLMYIHENGAPEANIPARPVVHPAIQSIQPNLAAGFRQAGKQALDGDMNGMLRTYNALGITAQNAMRARITNGPFVPLSERTIAARRAKGRTGIKPLIETGQLRRALTYVIRRIAGTVYQMRKGKVGLKGLS